LLLFGAVTAVIIIGAGFVETCTLTTHTYPCGPKGSPLDESGSIMPKDYGQHVACEGHPEDRPATQTWKTCASFWNSFHGIEHRALVDMEYAEENTSPLNITHVIVNHPAFKEAKGIPSTLQYGITTSTDSIPRNDFNLGCFKTHTGETWYLSFAYKGEGWMVSKENGTRVHTPPYYHSLNIYSEPRLLHNTKCN
jgi:hypothetical protein